MRKDAMAKKGETRKSQAETIPARHTTVAKVRDPYAASELVTRTRPVGVSALVGVSRRPLFLIWETNNGCLNALKSLGHWP